uniref:DC1 domain-containing protein n=1 Tax=Lactuca sativa TaxID=4236 RepID=A0A9R1VF57_LACSA|nr:hypothetical protein LSAT_V11C500247160 [Lactuca sativa]
MEEIKHFSHENPPLNLINSEMIVGARFDGGDKKNHKSLARMHVKIPYQVALHILVPNKACALLPPTFNEPSLYHRPLTLINLNPITRSWKCAVCRIRKKSRMFPYTFEKDNIYFFKACIDCCVYRITRKAEVDAIKEEAKMKLRPGSFHCDACQGKGEGLFYQCNSGDFWIHKTCASLTHTINLPHHPNHKLVLVYSLPEIFFNLWYYCGICNEYIQQNEWLYHSTNCRYFVHIRCALNTEQPSGDLSTSFVDEDVEDLLEFPMLEAFTDPLKLLNLC